MIKKFRFTVQRLKNVFSSEYLNLVKNIHQIHMKLRKLFVWSNFIILLIVFSEVSQ